MNKYRILQALLVTSLIFTLGCEEIVREPLSKDGTPPGPVTAPAVKNIPGGALITYQLPNETDLLYVKAEYELSNGVKVETKSSIYTNSVKVEGFGDTKEREVKLYAVDRSENVSSPITVKVQPQTPPVHAVKNTMSIIPDFGEPSIPGPTKPMRPWPSSSSPRTPPEPSIPWKRFTPA